MSQPQVPCSIARLQALLGNRTCNVVLRTAHIVAMGILLGGHFYSENPKSELIPALWLCIATGLALAASETRLQFVWFHQGRGLTTLAKLVLMCCVPLFWDYRVARLAILVLIVVLASVGSHVSARFRYYSILYKTVITSNGGPGTSRLPDDEAAASERSDDPSQ